LVKERFKSIVEIPDELYDEETRLLRSMTVNESVKLWLKMQAAFEWQLQQSAPWFEADHRNALIELQAKLRRLVD
jgi:hypothetical protein